MNKSSIPHPAPSRRAALALPLLLRPETQAATGDLDLRAVTGLSNSLLANTSNVMAALYGQIRARRQNSGHFVASSIMLRVFFDHLEETGVNRAIQHWIVSNPNAFSNFDPASGQIQLMRVALARLGANTSDEDVAACFRPSLVARRRVVEAVQQSDLRSVEEEWVVGLMETARWQPASAKLSRELPGIPLRTASWCEAADWGSAFLGIAALAQTMPPVGVAMGAAGVALWAASKVAC